jgi:2-polyprenyl-6-methoxyphenol hydroxylase-like FAD-dependent oxidoreductase
MFKGIPDVLIAGAGPVGLFTALCLKRLGISVRIIDTGIWPCAHSYALALHPRTLEMLRNLHLLERVLERSYPVSSVGLCDRKGERASIRVGDADAPATCIAVLPQDALEGLLERALEEVGIQVHWRHELSDVVDHGTGVKVTIDEYEKESRGYVIARTEWVVGASRDFEVPFVVGADGYNSGVRRALGFEFRETGPASYYAVFECQTDAQLDNEMRLVLDDGTTDVLWPLGNGACRWSFQLLDYADPEAERLKDYLSTYGLPTKRAKDRLAITDFGQLPVLDASNLEQLLAERAPWFRGSIQALTWRTVVRFERRLATAFGRGRLWLAGDAAHLTGPAGIQSLNSGLAEGYDLAEAISGVLKEGKPLSVLDAHNQRWATVWRKLHGVDGAITVIGAADPWIREHALQLVGSMPAIGAEMRPMAEQVGLLV